MRPWLNKVRGGLKIMNGELIIEKRAGDCWRCLWDWGGGI